jgi:hypothetical protein
MKGKATKLMKSIIEKIEPTWERFIKWPSQELGFELV